MSPSATNALVVRPPLGSLGVAEGPRGAGLSQLGRNLSSLFADAAEAARPLTNMLAVGIAKEYSTLPPLPSYVQGVQHYGGGQQNMHRESLWETLELVVAYERFRSKDIKAMEEAKWDHARASEKLGKRSSKQVPQEKAQKQQKAINQAHQKVQELDGKIQRLGMQVTSTSQAIEAIKTQMLLPALAFMLPGLVHMWVRLAELHHRQFQLALDVVGNQRLQSKLVGGKAVHLTAKSHQQDWKTLETALQKWEQAFSNSMNAQKKVLVNIIAWLTKINPNALGAPPPLPVQIQYLQPPPLALGPGAQPYPQQQQQPYQQQQGPYPAQGGAPAPPYPQPPAPSPPEPTYGMPRGPPGVQPIITDPDEASGPQPAYNSGAIVPVRAPQYPPNYTPPPNELFNKFLGGSPSGGEPLVALCNDWSKAMDNLSETEFKAAVFSFIGWVKQVEEKHALEAKELKKMEDMQKQVDKAKAVFEASLKKERELRNTLASPYGNVPMSKSLHQATQQAGGQGGSPAQSGASSRGMPRDASSAEISDTGTSGPQNQLWLPPVQSPPHEGVDSPLPEDAYDKAGAKAQAKEQQKEVKAFALAKEVDLHKGMLEGAKHKLRDATTSFEAMALSSRHTAMTGFEQTLPGVFQALSAYATNAGQMYGMLQYQHFRG
eukprot:TRINITY_DN248_c0_g1_i3.p1 TRINITY_DN248_c0_g1~~TRINITY_DN248_c0_g1_i3.p1  ORF type:complete len:677 (+),score=191.95 TRINITY_DN248_c0_g1_i3:53-2032(+)